METAVILISKVIRIDATLPPLEGDTMAAVKPPVEGASTVKINSPTLQRKRGLQKHTPDPPVKLNHTETEIVILSEDNSQYRKRRKLGVPIVIDIDSGSESSTDSETLIPSDLSNRSRAFFEAGGDQPDLVLETTVAGSGEIRLVYCPNNNLLSYFITEVRRKYRLRQEQEIVGIKVKTGDKMFNVDLDECRDWRYISGVIRKNGGRAEMVVSIN